MTLERSTVGTERPLDAPLLTFDIPTLLAQVKQESAWRTGSRNAITLLKTQGLRVVLVALHAGTAIPSHLADGPITVQVLEGQLVFSVESKHVTVAPGQLLTLQPGIAHGLEAAAMGAHSPDTILIGPSHLRAESEQFARRARGDMTWFNVCLLMFAPQA